MKYLIQININKDKYLCNDVVFDSQARFGIIYVFDSCPSITSQHGICWCANFHFCR